MNKEVEKKYLLKMLPADLGEGKKVSQGYLDKEEYEVMALVRGKFGDELDLEKIKEVRIRQKGENEQAKYFLTLKSDGTLEREEYEITIAAEEFESLWPLATEGTIKKTRFEIALENGLICEIDLYEGKLEGLVTMEIEYDPETTDETIVEKAILAITSEVEDVTEIKTYKNKVLAKIQSLEELWTKVTKEKDEKMMRDLNANPNQFQLA